MSVNGKTLRVLFIFTIGLILGLVMGTLGAGFRGSGERQELREHLEQVNRDLRAAIDSQREAAERASSLQAELEGVTKYARYIEDGTRRITTRAGSLEARRQMKLLCLE